MSLHDMKKKKQMYDGQMYLIEVNLRNNYQTEVITMAKEVYGFLKKDYDEGSIPVDMYTAYLRKLNNYVKEADEEMYPIEQHL